MATLTFSEISAALKTFYLPVLRVQINEEADPLWAELEKSTDDVSGAEVKFALRYGRSGGVGSRDDDGDLPTPNARKTLQATATVKNTFARMQLTTKVIESSRNDRGSFIRGLEVTLDDLLTDARDNVQRQAYGDGVGKLATFAASPTAATTLTLDGVIGLFEGQLVDVLRGDTNVVLHAGVEITAVNDDDNQVVVGTAVTADHTRSDYITIAGSYNKEMTGISKVFTPNNTIYGVNRATYKFFNPRRINVNGEISEVAIQTGLDKAHNRTGVKPDFLLASHGVRRAWQVLLTAQRQTVNTVELKGGWKVPAYENGSGNLLPFVAAKYAPAGRIRAIAKKNWRVAWYGDWNWMDMDGAILHRVANKAAYEATLQLFAEILCDLPAAQIEYYGITEASI